ncbi:hypothetical protein B0T14DRAFT_98529 [Immersiella caudata]|uniref:Uncharacterized protein n=1 Tax=Immersiella caudata TaxID=314043 RepID=A0AA39X2V8_9PEZI|nr:hypothetical protein B0T14DRAFT_98529 [Immersiella caudata]
MQRGNQRTSDPCSVPSTSHRRGRHDGPRIGSPMLMLACCGRTNFTDGMAAKAARHHHDLPFVSGSLVFGVGVRREASIFKRRIWSLLSGSPRGRHRKRVTSRRAKTGVWLGSSQVGKLAGGGVQGPRVRTAKRPVTIGRGPSLPCSTNHGCYHPPDQGFYRPSRPRSLDGHLRYYPICSTSRNQPAKDQSKEPVKSQSSCRPLPRCEQ